MNKAKISLLLVFVLGVTGLTQGLSGKNVLAAKKFTQPEIGVTVKNKITVDGYVFKDSDGDHKLDKYEDWRLSPQDRAKDLVSKMTLDEKVGQMVINSRPMGIYQKDKTLTSHDGILDEEYKETINGFDGKTISYQYGTTESIVDKKITHFIIRMNPQPGDLATWVNTMNEVAEGTRLGIPVILTSNPRNHASSSLVFGFQESSGVFSTWPNALGLAAAQDVKAVREFAEIAREEWDATNIRKMYGYLADVATDPRWYRISETFGEDPKLTAKYTTALVEGFQGKKGLTSSSVALTTKHFPGGGARENGTDPHYDYGQWNVYPTPGSLEKYHLPAFEAAVKAGTSGMMPYYAAPSNIKSTPQLGMTFEEVGMAYNSAIINGLLRTDLGFKGYVNSDSGILDAMAWGVQNLDIEQRAAKAVLAGTDIISDTNNVAAIKGAVEKGYLPIKNVNQSAGRVLTEMFELGLFENPYRDPEVAEKVVSNPENWEKAYAAHQKSVVMLKNENNILPLTDEKTKNAKLYVEVLGDKVTDVEQAKLIASIKKNDPNIQITNNVDEASYALLFLRPNDTSNKQQYMLYDLKIHSFTKIDMDKVNAIQRKVPTIISVNLNMPWLLDNLEPGSAALLAGFNTFTEATMDVVRGRFAPVGKLPFTIPASEAAIAVDPVTHENISGYATDVPGYDKGAGYQYKDEAGNIYVSGFGLTYNKK